MNGIVWDRQLNALGKGKEKKKSRVSLTMLIDPCNPNWITIQEMK